MIKYTDIAKVIGQEKLNKLLEFTEDFMSERRIYYWQEVLFEKMEKELPFKAPKTANEFLEMFSGENGITSIREKSLKNLAIDGKVTSLPEEYVKLVESLDDNGIYHFNDSKDESPDFEGRPWYIKSIKNLSEEINVYGSGKKPFYNCLKLFLDLHLEFIGYHRVKSNCGELNKERVYNGFVIGEENGDYLYLDIEDNFSVWIFYHDGCDVQRVAYSFYQWLNGTKENQ